MNEDTQERLASLFAQRVWSRAELRTAGLSKRRIQEEVSAGRMLRIRRDNYARPEIDGDVREAVRIGGRLTCTTLLSKLGVFVHIENGLHLQLDPGTSRIRQPANQNNTTLHWPMRVSESPTRHLSSLKDAVTHAVRCQQPRAALATLDSVLNKGLLTHSEIVSILRPLPARFHALIPLLDGSADSGPETFVRLILRSLGVSFRAQVRIDGVGRVDFLVDGWLIIECDSKAHHSSWEQQQKDRNRDIAAMRQGYVPLRLLAADILQRPEWVRDALREAIAVLAPRYGVTTTSED